MKQNDSQEFERLYQNGLRMGWHELVASIEAAKKVGRGKKK